MGIFPYPGEAVQPPGVWSGWRRRGAGDLSRRDGKAARTMMDEKWVPTALIKDSERPPVPIVDELARTRFRRLKGFGRMGLLLVKIILLKLTGRLNAMKLGRLFGNYCQQMGVLWIKVGQLMSMRSDLFPLDLCTELARLQDRAEGFSPDLSREIIERELGSPLEKVFADFEEHPFAAASIAQVHKAFLKKEKVKVAIKVRRPLIDKVFHQDMSMIRKLFLVMARFSIMSYMRWPDMLWELEQVFNEELDYRYEIASQQRLRKTLSRHDIYAPKIFERYCTRQIIVMEYVEAVSMADYLRVLESDGRRLNEWRKQNNIDPDRVGKRLFSSYLRQVLEDNLFHADLHPGNIFLLRDSRIVLLDFGSVGSSEGDLLRKYDAYLEALSTGQYAKAIDLFLLIMPDLPSGCLTEVKEEMQRRLHAWDSRCRVKELPFKEKSTSTVSDELTRVMARYGVTINWTFFKMLRGWITMDTSLRQLIPEADLPRVMQAYTRKRRGREFRKVISHMPGDIFRLQNLIDYPREFFEMAIYKGASVRRLAQVFEGTATRVARLVAMFFEVGSAFCFIFAAIFGFLVLGQHTELFSFEPGSMLKEILDVLPKLDYQVWFILIAIMLNGFISLARLAGRFRKQD
jgi:ubiquinone biosynthesis protein